MSTARENPDHDIQPHATAEEPGERARPRGIAGDRRAVRRDAAAARAPDRPLGAHGALASRSVAASRLGRGTGTARRRAGLHLADTAGAASLWRRLQAMAPARDRAPAAPRRRRR